MEREIYNFTCSPQGGKLVIVIAQVPGIYGSKQTESEGVA